MTIHPLFSLICHTAGEWEREGRQALEEAANISPPDTLLLKAIPLNLLIKARGAGEDI